MKNWTVGRQIFANSAILIGLLLVVSASSFYALNRITVQAEVRLRDDTIPGINAAATIATATLRGHIRAIMAAQARTPEQRRMFTEQMNDAVQAVDAGLKTYEAAISQAEDRANFDRIKGLRTTYIETRNTFLALAEAGKVAEADTLLVEKVDPAFGVYRDHILTMLKWNADAAVGATEEIISTSARARTTTVTIAAVALLAAIGIGWVVIRGINRTLANVTTQVDEASTQITAAASQVSAGSQSLAEGSSEQAASLEETSSSLEELAAMTKRNADSASNAKSLANETRSAAEAGNNDMHEMRRAMDSIKSSSDDIAKIIKSIDEIAFQTNILALNAAVEAARAGEAGMGFAVVAEEVRNLAQRSAEAAKETASKIEVAIRNGDNGVHICAKVAEALEVIVTKARAVDTLVAEIATASQEQSQGIVQINSATSQMDKVTQSNASNAEENAAAAEELNAQSHALRASVVDLQRLIGSSSAGASAPASEKSQPASTGTVRPVVRKGPPSTSALATTTVSANGHRPQPALSFDRQSQNGAPSSGDMHFESFERS